VERINVGLIGCGRIMPAHLHGYKALIEKGVNVRIAALCARKREDAERFIERGRGFPPREPVGPPGDPLTAPHIYIYDFQRDQDVEVYTDYREMLRKADIDAVEIYTPVYTHHTIALDSLEAGKHVLVEKPLAISVKACWRMVKTAEKAGLVLGVAECLRYGFGGTRETKWILEQRYIGDVQMVFQGGVGGYWSPNKILGKTPWRHRKLLAGAGVTLDFGVHLFHALRYLFGKITSISSIVRRFEDIRVDLNSEGEVLREIKSEVDDSFFTLINFESGAVGLVFFSVSGHGEPLEIPGGRVIYGSKGCVKGDLIRLDDGTEDKVSDIFRNEAPSEVKEKFFPLGIKDSFALETLDFLRAIREGGEMEANGREGLRDVALSYAMIESSIHNRVVKPEEVEYGELADYEKEIDDYYRI